MRPLHSVLVVLALLAISVTSSAAKSPHVVMPGQVKWMTQQPGNFQMAVVYGDPSKSGFYVIRLKLPSNWSFPPHHHPTQENVTVLSGTFYAGIGAKMNKSTAGAFPAGSFIALPANVKHYAFTKSGPVVIQIDGMGPNENIMEKM